MLARRPEEVVDSVASSFNQHLVALYRLSFLFFLFTSSKLMFPFARMKKVVSSFSWKLQDTFK